MKWFFFLGLFLSVWAFTAPKEYRALQAGNTVELLTPYGNKLLFGDIGFDSIDSYRFEVPLKDFRTASPNGSGHPQASNQPAPESFSDEDSLVLEANRLYNQAKFNEAVRFVDEILRRNPAHVRAWLMKGSLMHATGNKDLARNAWKRVLELQPGNTQIKTLLESYP